MKCDFERPILRHMRQFTLRILYIATSARFAVEICLMLYIIRGQWNNYANSAAVEQILSTIYQKYRPNKRLHCCPCLQCTATLRKWFNHQLRRIMVHVYNRLACRERPTVPNVLNKLSLFAKQLVDFLQTTFQFLARFHFEQNVNSLQHRSHAQTV
jgi:hypothetical protein